MPIVEDGGTLPSVGKDQTITTNELRAMRETPTITSQGALASRPIFLYYDGAGNPVYRIQIQRSRIGSDGRMTTVTETTTRAWNGTSWIPPSGVTRASEGGITDPRATSALIETRRHLQLIADLKASLNQTGSDTSRQGRIDSAQAWLVEYATGRISQAEIDAIMTELDNLPGNLSDANLMRYITDMKNSIAGRIIANESPADPTVLNPGRGGGGGGGGLGALLGPVYIAPDERVVGDQVSGILVNLIGSIDEDFKRTLVDLYMREDRRNFDEGLPPVDRGAGVWQGSQVDPTQSVIEAIRNSSEYQRIHRLRPDGTDERTWISSRRTIGEQSGLMTSQLDDFGVDQAKIGGDLTDLQSAAATRQFKLTGKAPAFLENRFRGIAQNIARSLQ